MHRFLQIFDDPSVKSAIAKKRRIQYDTDRDFFPLVAEYIYYVLLYLLTLHMIWIMAIENRSIVELTFALRFEVFKLKVNKTADRINQNKEKSFIDTK